jgi:hypothetical protein
MLLPQDSHGVADDLSAETRPGQDVGERGDVEARSAGVVNQISQQKAIGGQPD